MSFALFVSALVAGTSTSLAFAARSRWEADRADREAKTAAKAAAEAKESARRSERWLKESMTSYADYYTGFTAEALRGGQLPPTLRTRLLEKPRQFYDRMTKELAAQPEPSALERNLLAHSQYDLGRVLYELGAAHDGRQQAEAAVASFRKLAAEDPTDPELRYWIAASQERLAKILGVVGLHEQEVETYRSADTILLRLTDAHPDEWRYQFLHAVTEESIGTCLMRTGRLEEAASELRQSVSTIGPLVVRKPEWTEGVSLLGATYSNLGYSLYMLGRSGESLQIHEEAVTSLKPVCERVADPEAQYALSGAYLNLALAYAKLGQSAKKLVAMQNARATAAAVVARQPSVPRYRSMLSVILLDLAVCLGDRLSEATLISEEALRVCEPLVAEYPDAPEYRYRLGLAQMNHVALLREMGKTEEASAQLAKGTATFEALLAIAPDVPEYKLAMAWAIHQLGMAQFRRADLKAARREIERGVALRKDVTRTHPQIIENRADLARSLADLAYVEAKSALPLQAAQHLREAVQYGAEPFFRNPNDDRYKEDIRSVIREFTIGTTQSSESDAKRREPTAATPSKKAR
jgi:tetratricopeptide (TPR) repeat protein